MAKIVNIEDAQEGQILSEPISNSYGQQLLLSGSVLENRHIQLLARWNVKHVFIQDDESPIGELSEEEYNRIVDLVNARVHWEAVLSIEKDLINSAYLRKAMIRKI